MLIPLFGDTLYMGESGVIMTKIDNNSDRFFVVEQHVVLCYEIKCLVQ